MDQLEATVEGTVYRNAENGYSVVTVKPEQKIGLRTVTVVGTLPMLSGGEMGIFSGEWMEHPQYGRQFKCQKVDLQRPTTLQGILKYLSSGIIHGVGTKTARDIVNCFGEDTLKILDEHPERLQEVPNMGKKRWKQIIEDYQQQQSTRAAMVFLQTYGVSASLALKISKVYGERTQAVIRANPYQLCDDIDGVGFKTADAIGTAIGIPPDSDGRISAALKYVLRDQAVSMGHVYLPMDELLNRCTALLRVSREMVAHQLKTMQLLRELVISGDDGDEHVYLPAYDSAEREVATRLCELMASTVPSCATDAEDSIDAFEARYHIEFSQRQREAILMALRRGLLVITGGPGTGKTTIIKCIISLLSEFGEVVLCAPTGRAAKRMTETTGHEAKTIHRLLEVDYSGGVVSFIHNDKNLLKCDVVILDEMSMVDVKLFQALIAALRYSCRIIMVGDADQLPSVGAGNILSEVIRSGCVPTVCLNEIFRQAKRSLIVENAHHIISGEPLQKGSKTDDFFFLETDGEAAQRLVCDLVTTRLPRSYGFDPIRDIQVLCPTKLGPTGTQALNVELQNLLNPPQKGKPQLQSAARVFRVGDKVMQVRNNYEIVWNRIGGEQGVGAYNGDIGIVESINLRERSMVVRMDDRRLLYPAENLNELEIAYAITVHKSQGSEFPAVILPVAQVPPRLCYRNLFYTGVTRARRLCVVAGRRDVVNSMMSNIRQNLRYSGLCALLQAGQPPQQLSPEGESP